MFTKKLSEWYATAICGNEITSSRLYVSALAIVAAGQYAWVGLFMVPVVFTVIVILALPDYLYLNKENSLNIVFICASKNIFFCTAHCYTILRIE